MMPLKQMLVQCSPFRYNFYARKQQAGNQMKGRHEHAPENLLAATPLVHILDAANLATQDPRTLPPAVIGFVVTLLLRKSSCCCCSCCCCRWVWLAFCWNVAVAARDFFQCNDSCFDFPSVIQRVSGLFPRLLCRCRAIPCHWV
jgi:hypothetical protein